MNNGPLQYYSEDELKKFIQNGVIILDKNTIKIEKSIPLENINPGVILYPFCKIEGLNTFIGANSIIGICGSSSIINTSIGKNSRIGTLGSVSLNNSFIGPGTILGSGSSEESVFLGKETFVNNFSTGYGFRTRKGSLYEEDASSAQNTDTKMTILFPWTTLGSNTNFCDILLSGGNSPNLGQFSEIGSGSIHFNFSPSGDKITSSLLGNVIDGVFLNKKSIFIGGNNSLIGPINAEFGSSTAAGSKINNTIFEGLNFGSLQKIDFQERDFRILFNVSRNLNRQINYIGELCALKNWYKEIRINLIAEDKFTTRLYKSGMDLIIINIEEKIKQIFHCFYLLDKSVELLSSSRIKRNELIKQKHLLSSWEKIKIYLESIIRFELPCPENVTNKILELKKKDITYTSLIQKLDYKTIEECKIWLKNCKNKSIKPIIEIL